MDASPGHCQLVLSARTQTRTAGSRARVRPQPREAGKVSDLSLLNWKRKALDKLNSRVPSQPKNLASSDPTFQPTSAVKCGMLWSGCPGSKPKTSPWLLLPYDPSTVWEVTPHLSRLLPTRPRSEVGLVATTAAGVLR